jgi:nucleotide-binding universal stress UspA family protein
MRPEPQKVLVVATRTAACSELIDVLTARATQVPATFNLLVPATPYGWAWLADMYSGGVDAERYLAAAVEKYRAAGLTLESAQLGDPDPVAAVMDAVHFARYDEIVVSTLPRHLSKWLRLSLPHRLRAISGLPVTHVVGSQARLADRTDKRRGDTGHKDRGHSVYLDGQGSARVLGLEEARSSALGSEGLQP